MTIKDLKNVLVHFQDRKYDDYEVVFWDSSRQLRMDATFTGLSHPDKEISFNVRELDSDRVYERMQGTPTSLPDTLPSPFKEGEVAVLMKEENFDCLGVPITRYFYQDPEGHQFGTTASETFTMAEYYCEVNKRNRKRLREAGLEWD